MFTNDERESASKTPEEVRLVEVGLTDDGWKATPLRFSPFQSVLSRLTPRVIVIAA